MFDTLPYTLDNLLFSSPEQKAQVSFSDQNLSVVLGFGAGVGVNVSHLLQKH